jgi:hypothetical protein
VVATVADTLSYVDTNLAAGTTYYYEVAAANVAGTSGYSNLAWATTLTNGASLPFCSLILWLKADSGVVQQSTNNSVKTWFDQSGNYNQGNQNTATLQPFFITNAINGLPVVRFYGTNYFQLLIPLTNTTAMEALVVLKVATNPPSASQSLWGWGGNNSPDYYPDASGKISDDFGSESPYNTPYNVGAPLQPLAQYHLYGISGANANWAAWINGVAQVYTNYNFYGTWSDSWNLGAGKGNASPFAGDVAEVLVFNRMLSAGERDTLDSYLAAKYGLAQFATNTLLPGPPTNFVTVGIAPFQLNLQWTPAATNVSSYHIERKLGTNGAYQEIGVVPSYVSNFVDTTAFPTNLYFYQVKAHNLFGDSNSSVISPPLTSLTILSTNTYILVGSTNLLVVPQASDAYGSISQVEIANALNPPVVLGGASSVPYTNYWVPSFQNAYSFTALATDTLGNSQYSTPLTVIVYLDSIGDGIPDFLQVEQGNDPLNPWVPPVGGTNNVPPNIFLYVPTNATLLP